MEICVPQQGYGLAWITETPWKNSHGWSVATEGHRPFTKDRLALREGTLVNVKEQQEHTELCLGQGVSCLGIYGSELEDKPGSIVGDVCYKLSDQ